MASNNNHFKTTCRYFKQGNCRNGSNCRFIHEKDHQSEATRFMFNNSEFGSTALRFPRRRSPSARLPASLARFPRPIVPTVAIPRLDSNFTTSNTPVAASFRSISSQPSHNSRSRSSSRPRNRLPANESESDLSDTLSDLSHSTSSSSTINKIGINPTDEFGFILKCNTAERINANYRLKEYVLIQRSQVMKFFLSEKFKLNNKRYEAFKLNPKSYDEQTEALKNEEKLLIKYEEEFNSQMNHLDKFLLNTPIPKFYIKTAFDREFKRAQLKLPIYAYRDEIIQKLKDNNVIIIVGFTGSGKTT